MDGWNKQKEAEQRDCQRTLLLPPSSRPQKVASSSICGEKEASNCFVRSWRSELDVSEQEGKGYHEEYVEQNHSIHCCCDRCDAGSALTYLCKAMQLWHMQRHFQHIMRPPDCTKTADGFDLNELTSCSMSTLLLFARSCWASAAERRAKRATRAERTTALWLIIVVGCWERELVGDRWMKL